MYLLLREYRMWAFLPLCRVQPLLERENGPLSTIIGFESENSGMAGTGRKKYRGDDYDDDFEGTKDDYDDDFEGTNDDIDENNCFTWSCWGGCS